MVGNQSFQRIYSNRVVDTFLAVLWPWQARGGKGLPARMSWASEGHAWAWISYIIIEHLVYVDCNNGEAFIRPVLTLSCSPCGFKHTRASLEDLDAVQALRHLLESPIWETAVRLQRALKIWD